MKVNFLLLAVITHLVLAIFRILYVLYRDIDLSPEEAQYWLWSKHLDLSYYSKPPIVAYMNFVSTSILGDTEIGVRINAILIGFLIAVITFFFYRYFFKDEKGAFVASLFIYVFPTYDLASILFLTDTPLALFWVLTVMFFYKAVKEDKPKFWILTGVFAGLGFLSKYVMVLFLPVVLLFLFIFERKVFFNRWFYVSIFIASLFTIPVIVWNLMNDFVSFKHVGTLAGAKTDTQFSLNLKTFGDYIIGQIGFGFGFIFPLSLLALLKAFKRKEEKLIYLALFPVVIFVFFLIISLHKKVEANWPVFSYFSLYILTAYYFLFYRKYKQAVIFSILNLFAVVVLFYTPLIDKLGMTRLLPPEKDPTKRLIGWEDLAKNIESEIKKLNTQKYFIFSDSYHISSEMAFYLKPFKQTYCIRLWRRMNQFDLWEGISKFENKNFYGIYIADHYVPKKIKDGFEEVVKEYSFPVKYRGKEVKRFYIMIGKNYRHIDEDPIKSY